MTRKDERALLDRPVERVTVDLAQTRSRRSFLGRLGTGFVALAGGPFVAAALRPERAEAYHVCGHTYTTGSCPHPFSPQTRIDKYGYPVHPKDGYPIDDEGNMYTSEDQTRSLVCQEIVPKKYEFVKKPSYGGGWSRCCHGRIRRIADCCSRSDTRINGDASVTGYCYNEKKVFCIAFRDTNVECG